MTDTTVHQDADYIWFTAEDGRTLSYSEADATFWRSTGHPAALPEQVSSLAWSEAGGESCGADVGTYGQCIAPAGHTGKHADANGHRFESPNLTTRYGVEITEIDPATSFIGTADGMGHGAPLRDSRLPRVTGQPTVPATDSTPWFDRDTADADVDPETGVAYLDTFGADDDRPSVLAPFVRNGFSLARRTERLARVVMDFDASTPRREAAYRQYRRLTDFQAAQARQW